MRLLLVDGEPPRQYLRQRLTTEGFEVTGASYGADAERRILADEIDLLLLWGKPGESARRAVLEFARLHRPTMPVIVISPHEDVADRLATLDAGASDFLVEPVACGELAARVRAQVRRAFWMSG